MLSVEEARALIEGHAKALPTALMPLDRTLGRVLAGNVHATDDSPPFAKALVDGYALRTQDLLSAGLTRLRITDEIDAGAVPQRALEAGSAALVMTGAPLPEGCDAVVMIEHAEVSNGFVTISRPVRAHQNRLERGAEYRAGELLCAAGTRIGAPQIGLLASAGVATVRAYGAAGVTIVATGNELVSYDQVPGPGQIRNSNAPMLAALLCQLGADPQSISTEHVRDEMHHLASCFERARNRSSHGSPDILVFSGGVSAGRRDLVPHALTDAGFRCVFHKVALKPGKPLWFGVGPDRGDRPPVLAFGLPGNPVSGLVCSLLFIKPALDILSGGVPPPMISQTAALAAPYQHEGDRLTFQPARLQNGSLSLLRWAGSADMRTVAQADGFAMLGPGSRAYNAAEQVGFLPLPSK